MGKNIGMSLHIKQYLEKGIRFKKLCHLINYCKLNIKDKMQDKDLNKI